jgi:hypothetical protein
VTRVRRKIRRIRFALSLTDRDLEDLIFIAKHYRRQHVMTLSWTERLNNLMNRIIETARDC